jgi:hypothetical protein
LRFALIIGQNILTGDIKSQFSFKAKINGFKVSHLVGILKWMSSSTPWVSSSGSTPNILEIFEKDDVTCP